MVTDGANLSIGYVDDRRDFRESIALTLQPFLPESARIVARAPFATLDEYPLWVAEEEICFLLLDEKLHQQSQAGYSGHQAARLLSVRIPDLPVWIVTQYTDDEELREHAGDADRIVEKQALVENPETYASRMVTKAARYSIPRSELLGELGRLADKIARGHADNSDRDRVLQIQHELQISIYTSDLLTRSVQLEMIESELKALEDLQAQFEAHLVADED